MTFPQDTLPFLQELILNNNRPWFQANKTRYDDIHAVLIDFCAAIIEGLSKDDPSVEQAQPKDCIYRIYRDIRFSQDKRPYKDHFSFWIPCGGNKHQEVPGYYMQIAAEGNELGGGSCLGGGVYVTQKETPNILRQEIFYQMDEFLSVIHDKNYIKYYGHEFWDPLPAKTVPFNFRKMIGGLPDDYPHADLLKHRNYVSMHNIPNGLVSSDKLLSYCLEAFRATVPLNKFFLDALRQNN